MNKFEAANILGLSGKINADCIKKAYRVKAKEFHPDRNPAGAEMMKVINAAFDALKGIEELEVFENSQAHSYPEELNKALNKILNLNGLIIEVCGLWVWLSGDTKAHKDIIKEAGFKWAKNKKMWFYRPEIAKGRKYRGNTKEWSMETIREAFGVSQPESQQLKAYISISC